MERNAGPRFEVQGGRLYVNGERQAVARATVLMALAIANGPGAVSVSAAGGPVDIPAVLGRTILRMEAHRACRLLARALAPIDAA